MDSVASQYELSLLKTASTGYIEMWEGESAPLSFTIEVNATAMGSFSIAGNIFVDNTGDWPANVTDVSDTIWYKAGGPAWYPAPCSITTTVPIGPEAISTGDHTYSYSGSFTLPVDLQDVTAMSNLILITIDNHPHDGIHVFHYREDFMLPAEGDTMVYLEDLETVTPPAGLSYTVDSVTVNGAPASLSGPWDLDLTDAPFTVVINKTLTGDAAGLYLMNNLASIGDLSSGVDVEILVKERTGTIEGAKIDESQDPVAGVAVQLWQGDAMVDDTVTDENGHYSFAGLAFGIYTVMELVPDGWEPISKTSVEVAVDGIEPVIVDFQNGRLASISGTKWDDLNGDGIVGATDPGLAGVTIQLWLEDAMVDETVTGEGGSYSFGDLMPGDYTVVEVVPDGMEATSPVSVDVTLEYGDEVDGVDFLNARLASISGTKWDDLNGDGIVGATDPGLAGVTIQLWLEEAMVDETVTGEGGSYSFGDLEPGDYVVMEIVPEGMYATSPVSIEVKLAYGGDVTGVDFLNAPHASISGTKWDDTNADGIHQSTEAGVPNVTITLSLNGAVVAYAITAAGGTYVFDGLEAGTYTVTETLPSGTTNTTPVSVTVTLVPGQSVTGIDFLNVAVAGVVITPTTPAATAETLPYTGFNLFPWLLAAGLLALAGLLILTLGMALNRR